MKTALLADVWGQTADATNAAAKVLQSMADAFLRKVDYEIMNGLLGDDTSWLYRDDQTVRYDWYRKFEKGRYGAPRMNVPKKRTRRRFK